jgi:diaminopimelate epimerase
LNLAFTKMHGCGNDFVMVDSINQPLPPDVPQLARALNDRRLGVGGDGLILVLKGDSAPFRMRMFNPDGTEAEMCGNGIRCFAKYVREHGLTSEAVIPVETGAGLLELTAIDDQVRVNMGVARYKRGDIPMTGDSTQDAVGFIVSAGGTDLKCTAVNMGNPHCVTFVEEAASVPLEVWGPQIEANPLFPNRTNVHFAQVVSRNEIIQRTWERGAGVTLACGTGACAVAVAACLNGLAERRVLMHLPGGDLTIEYEESGTVLMSGPAVAVFEGVWAA